MIFWPDCSPLVACMKCKNGTDDTILNLLSLFSQASMNIFICLYYNLEKTKEYELLVK